MVFEGTRVEFIREFSAKPIGQHHLYEPAINQRSSKTSCPRPM
jgi:hypothetical protein